MTERDWLGWDESLMDRVRRNLPFVKEVFAAGVNEGIERANTAKRGMAGGPLNALACEIHENAVSKGWWDQERNPLEIHALIHSEISEATECARNGEPDFHVDEGKPEGEAVELADAVIRILDYAAKRGWDFDAVVKAKMEYNKTRPHRHGGKLY